MAETHAAMQEASEIVLDWFRAAIRCQAFLLQLRLGF